MNNTKMTIADITCNYNMLQDGVGINTYVEIPGGKLEECIAFYKKPSVERDSVLSEKTLPCLLLVRPLFSPALSTQIVP
jgi:hypothetical protein